MPVLSPIVNRKSRLLKELEKRENIFATPVDFLLTVLANCEILQAMPRRVYPDLHAYFADNPTDSALQVAKDVGCSMAHLSMIKWGTRQPGLNLALRLARRCQVPLESLLIRKTLKQSA